MVKKSPLFSAAKGVAKINNERLKDAIRANPQAIEARKPAASTSSGVSACSPFNRRRTHPGSVYAGRKSTSPALIEHNSSDESDMTSESRKRNDTITKCSVVPKPVAAQPPESNQSKRTSREVERRRIKQNIRRTTDPLVKAKNNQRNFIRKLKKQMKESQAMVQSLIGEIAAMKNIHTARSTNMTNTSQSVASNTIINKLMLPNETSVSHALIDQTPSVGSDGSGCNENVDGIILMRSNVSDTDSPIIIDAPQSSKIQQALMASGNEGDSMMQSYVSDECVNLRRQSDGRNKNSSEVKHGGIPQSPAIDSKASNPISELFLISEPSANFIESNMCEADIQIEPIRTQLSMPRIHTLMSLQSGSNDSVAVSELQSQIGEIQIHDTQIARETQSAVRSILK